MDQKQIPQRQIVSQEIHSEELYLGPLPEPEVLEKYKTSDPSFPERIMRMSEAHNEADVRTKNRISLVNLVVPITGQVFTLLLGARGILACVFLSVAGYTGGAVASIITSFSPMVISALRGLRGK
jgi:uncharacterized membrane protein